MRAIVVGGGIGGLSAAIALRQVGVEVVVFEKAGELREIGAGISLWANAMKALRELGLYEAVLAVGKPRRPKGELRSPNGRVFYKMPSPRWRRGLGARYRGRAPRGPPEDALRGAGQTFVERTLEILGVERAFLIVGGGRGG